MSLVLNIYDFLVQSAAKLRLLKKADFSIVQFKFWNTKFRIQHIMKMPLGIVDCIALAIYKYKLSITELQYDFEIRASWIDRKLPLYIV